MSDPQRHATAFDLPGWPCPPRVRDIPHHEGSWGWVAAARGDGGVIAQDDTGHLWADGAAVPAFQYLPDNHTNPGALVCWTEHGLGVYVHPKSLGNLRSISLPGMQPDQWVRIAVALTEPPTAAKTAGTP